MSSGGYRNDYDSQTDTSRHTQPAVAYVVLFLAFWTVLFCLCRLIRLLSRFRDEPNTGELPIAETRTEIERPEPGEEINKLPAVFVNPNGEVMLGFSKSNEAGISANGAVEMRVIQRSESE